MNSASKVTLKDIDKWILRFTKNWWYNHNKATHNKLYTFCKIYCTVPIQMFVCLHIYLHFYIPLYSLYTLHYIFHIKCTAWEEGGMWWSPGDGVTWEGGCQQFYCWMGHITLVAITGTSMVVPIVATRVFAVMVWYFQYLFEWTTGYQGPLFPNIVIVY